MTHPMTPEQIAGCDRPAISEHVAEGRRIVDSATALPWYTLDPPWLTHGPTSILSGSPDPHVATFVADMDVWLDDDDQRRALDSDADAALIVAAVNAYPAYLDLCERVGRLEEGLRDVISAADSFCDEEGYEVAGQVKIRARAALKETPHDQG